MSPEFRDRAFKICFFFFLFSNMVSVACSSVMRQRFFEPAYEALRARLVSAGQHGQGIALVSLLGVSLFSPLVFIPGLFMFQKGHWRIALLLSAAALAMGLAPAPFVWDAAMRYPAYWVWLSTPACLLAVCSLPTATKNSAD